MRQQNRIALKDDFVVDPFVDKKEEIFDQSGLSWCSLPTGIDLVAGEQRVHQCCKSNS